MDDYIKRSDAVHALCKAVHKDDGVIPCENQTTSCLWSKTRVCDYAREIDALPSAQSVTPMHWIPVNPFNGGWTARWECSACGSKVTLGYCTDVMEYDFCPYCGAKDGGTDG